MTGRIKALLVLVILMGFAIVIGTIVLAFAISQKLGGQDTRPLAAASIAVEPGTMVQSASSDGKQLVLLEQANGHQQIELRSLDGRLITRYAVTPQP